MSTFWIVAFTLVGLVNVALALIVLLHRSSGNEPAGLLRVCVAAFAVVVASAFETAGLALLGLRMFGLMHIAWIDISVVVPISGIAVFVGALLGRPSKASVKVVAALGLAVIPIAIDAMFITPFDLRLETADVALPAAREGVLPLKVAILADLQSTTVAEHQRNAIATIMSTEPDLILIPGDIFQGTESMFHAQAPSFRELLSELHAPGGVFAVQGNTDTGRLFSQLFDGTGIRVLNDEVVRFTVHDRKVALLGLSMAHFVWDERCQEFAREPGEDEVRIAMAHIPDAVYSLPRGSSRVDLFVAGHTHGGQVSFPFIGPPVILTSVPKAVAAGGLHDLDGRRIYISRGVGMERGLAPRIRWRVPPEVSLLTLK